MTKPSLCLTLALVCASGHAFATPAENPISFLTGPQEGAPLELAVGYLQAHRADYELTEADLEELEVTDLYGTKHNGVTHVYLRQRHQGVPVFNGVANVNVTADGAIINLGTRLVPDLARRIDAASPALAPEAAVLAAATHYGIEDAPAPLLLENHGGPTLEVVFAGDGISLDPIPVQLMYQPLDDGSVHLAWRLVIRHPATPDWWDVRVDASTGAVIGENNWTAHASYDVFPFPAESPDDTAQTTLVDPHDLTASPFGWHDTDGIAGADFTDTRGNNACARYDEFDTDVNNCTATDGVSGGAGLVFAYPWDENSDPEAGGNIDAAVVNLFYYNNVMHDVTYHYGFDEPAGNFQENTYGNGGIGGDAVFADAIDGSGVNNANFGTPGDGGNPRMQMYRWTYPFGQRVTVNSPGSIAGAYVANPSNNGGTANGLTANLTLVEDGVPPEHDGCQAITNDLTGTIALILWNQGACNSSVFVQNAADAGAVAAIMIDNTDEPRTNFGGSPSIPSVAVGLAAGTSFMTTLGSETVNVTIDDDPSPEPDRDSDLDNGVMAHEYGHGISNRLTGGPSNTGCLFGDEQAGEGWSDFWALVLSPDIGDAGADRRGIATYLTYEPETGAGIRNFPYTTDLAINPQTYEDIANTNVPHGVGEIWMSAVWEVYWELVTRYGFDPDLVTGTGGNNLTIQLVVDGMKLQGCGPTFVTARNAILQADLVNNGGANACAIWRGFAKRGLGVSASTGSVNVGDEVEAFDVPAGCEALLFSDGFESGSTTMWSSTVGGV